MVDMLLMNPDVMTQASETFAVSARNMELAKSEIHAAGAELQAAWMGVGVDRFEVIRSVVEEYCSKMAQSTKMESNNIISTQNIFSQEDHAIANSFNEVGE